MSINVYILHANPTIPSEVSDVYIWVANHVLMCAQKQKFCIRPTHYVVSKQIVHPLAQSDGELAGVTCTSFCVQYSGIHSEHCVVCVVSLIIKYT